MREMSEINYPGGALVPLSELKVGESGIIESYKTNGSIYFRLRELGLVRGTRVHVKRLAPFRDPVELVVRGYSLSLRKEDASHIFVKKTQMKNI